MKSVLCVLLLCVAGHAQTAKVVQLADADAKEAASLYAERDAINKKIEALENHIRGTYLSDHRPRPANTVCTSNQRCGVLSGWGFGEFVFSDDFKFIVPKPFPTSTPPTGYSGYVLNGNTLTFKTSNDGIAY